MKVWQCSVCKYIHKGETPPDKCPVCGVDSSKFVEIDPDAVTPGKKITSDKKAALEKATENQQVSDKKQKPSEKKHNVPPVPETGLEKIQHLLIKHHAHPVTVHLPNGILPVAVFLFIIGWLFSAQLPGKAAIINLVFVALALPVVIYTGILEWKKKYNGAVTAIFKIKIVSASITACSCVLSLSWYLIDSDVLSSSIGWVFILLNIIMLAAAGVAGHIGGKLVFKD